MLITQPGHFFILKWVHNNIDNIMEKVHIQAYVCSAICSSNHDTIFVIFPPCNGFKTIYWVVQNNLASNQAWFT